jgi:hypothetical protein
MAGPLSGQPPQRLGGNRRLLAALPSAPLTDTAARPGGVQRPRRRQKIIKARKSLMVNPPELRVSKHRAPCDRDLFREEPGGPTAPNPELDSTT